MYDKPMLSLEQAQSVIAGLEGLNL